MAVSPPLSSHFPFASIPPFPSSSVLQPSSTNFHGLSFSKRCFSFGGRRGGCRRRRSGGDGGKFVPLSAHSNAKILKSTRRPRYGQNLSPYDSDEDENDDDGWSSDDSAESEEYGTKEKRLQFQAESHQRQGNQRLMSGSRKMKSSKTGRSLSIAERHLKLRNSKYSVDKRRVGNTSYMSRRQKDGPTADMDLREETMENAGNRFLHLSEELDLDEKSFPLLDYLSTFGLKESHFIQMYERHMTFLQINIGSAQERLQYLLSVGVKERDIKRILLRQPQILEYTVENNLKAHIKFLVDMGIPSSKIGQIIAAAPSLFSYSVENSLKPTVRYLVEELGMKKNDIGKVVQLSPQILVQRIENAWNTRYTFFSMELGAPKDTVIRMVMKHPQLLHYSIEEGLLPRINFLRSIGMHNSDILKVLTNLTQVLSLSLEENLKPKYLYLINELQNEVQSLTKYPMYLSLSLDQRIRPRHKFLVSLKKSPKGPFPLSSLIPTDECFCQKWAETSLDNYLEFRRRLLLKEFAKQYERQR